MDRPHREQQNSKVLADHLDDHADVSGSSGATSAEAGIQREGEEKLFGSWDAEDEGGEATTAQLKIEWLPAANVAFQRWQQRLACKLWYDRQLKTFRDGLTNDSYSLSAWAIERPPILQTQHSASLMRQGECDNGVHGVAADSVLQTPSGRPDPQLEMQLASTTNWRKLKLGSSLELLDARDRAGSLLQATVFQ
jgi:hypothetical protein